MFTVSNVKKEKRKEHDYLQFGLKYAIIADSFWDSEIRKRC